MLVRAAELRDVGMIAVPQGAEDLTRLHPVIGERILAAAESMRPVARIVRAAHERYDGSGFPDGLRGEEIPLAARIIAACEGPTTRCSARPLLALRELRARLRDLLLPLRGLRVRHSRGGEPAPPA